MKNIKSNALPLFIFNNSNTKKNGLVMLVLALQRQTQFFSLGLRVANPKGLVIQCSFDAELRTKRNRKIASPMNFG